MLSILFSLLLPACVCAQSSSSVAAVPTVAVSPLDNYDSPYRPQIHFSPPQGFMNDANGLFIDPTGTYHLYYQLNPTELVAGNQHWGHATSPDLYHWTNQPIALGPSASEPDGLIFTGSAVLDPNNTSGFFPAGSLNSTTNTTGVIAIYTLATSSLQEQAAAYSTDNGYTFTKYAGNPVLNVNDANFRDPKVFWHAPTARWVMAVAFAQDYVIALYTSPDTRTWTHASNFSHAGLLGLQYECPNLVEVPVLSDAYAPADAKFAPANIAGTAWLLLVSINPGAPLGGSISQFFPGTFNGTHFEAADGAARLTDWAKDNYAAQFYDGIPGEQAQIMIPWASNWQYTDSVPTAPAGFRSAMALPRLTALSHTPRSPWTLILAPVPIPSSLFASAPLTSDPTLAPNNGTASTSTTLTNSTLYLDVGPASLPSRAFALTLAASSLDASTTGSLNFTLLASSTSEALRGGFLLGGDGTGTVWLDRGALSGFSSPLFTGQFSATYVLDPSGGAFEMMVVVDRSLVEVFLDGGVGPSGTAAFFASEAAEAQGGLDVLVLGSETVGLGDVSAEVRGLVSSWRGGGSGGANGTVGMDRRGSEWTGL